MLHLTRPSRQGEFPLRGVPTYTLSYMYMLSCTPTYRKPHHHHPKALSSFHLLKQLINLWLVRPSPPSHLQVPLASSHDKQRRLASHHRRVAAASVPEQVFFAGQPCPSRSAPDRLPNINTVWAAFSDVLGLPWQTDCLCQCLPQLILKIYMILQRRGPHSSLQPHSL